MAVSLAKGERITLTKEVEGLSEIYIGLGWDEAKKGGLRGLFHENVEDIDCDASVIMLQNGKFHGGYDKGVSDLVYFNNLEHKSGSVKSMGDNRTGGGDGDDEQIRIDLQRVPEGYDKLNVVVNIYKAMERKQHFGMIENAYCHIVDSKTGKELCRYDLTEDYSNKTGIVVGSLEKKGTEWEFQAIGDGVRVSSLSEMVDVYR